MPTNEIATVVLPSIANVPVIEQAPIADAVARVLANETVSGEAEAAKPAKAAKPSKPKAAKPAVATGPKRTASGGVDLSKPSDAPAVIAKPVTDTVAADAEAQRMRDLAAKYYNGASLAAHQRKPAKRDEYAARITKPVQRIGGSGPSTRDESGLALILSGANRSGAFDPVKLNLDLGIASRLASVGMLTFADDTFMLTKPGRERANLVVKRAA